MVKNLIKVVAFGVMAVVLAGGAKASLKESGKALAPMMAGMTDAIAGKIDQAVDKAEETESEED